LIKQQLQINLLAYISISKKKEKRKKKYTHYQTLVPTRPKLPCLLLLLPKKQKKGRKEKKII
jgi:hypothetical protein